MDALQVLKIGLLWRYPPAKRPVNIILLSSTAMMSRIKSSRKPQARTPRGSLQKMSIKNAVNKNPTAKRRL